MLAHTHNKLDGISKGCIHEATERLAEFGGQLLGRKTEECGERNDGDEVEDEGHGRVPLHGAREDAKRHEDEEDVDIAAGQHLVGEVRKVLGQRLEARLVLVRLAAADERRRLARERPVGGHHVVLRVRVLVVGAMTSQAVEVSLDGFWCAQCD